MTDNCRECQAALIPGQVFCTACGCPTHDDAVDELLAKLPAKKQRGGAREGAGRQPKGQGRRVTKSFRLEQWAIDRIEATAAATNATQADALMYIIEGDRERELMLEQAITELADALSVGRKENISRRDVRNALALLEQLRR
ncbi:hypothetical protein D3C72_737270 [compost metagenome]